MSARARLYDARAEDRDVELTRESLAAALTKADDRRLVWIDVDSRAESELDSIAQALDLEERVIDQLTTEGRRANILRFPDRIVVTLGLLEKNGDGELRRQELDVLVGRNLVVTVHEGALAAIDAFEEELSYERGLGELDAGAFMTGLVDAVLSTYFREIDEIDKQIERLDQLALRAAAGDQFLDEVVRLRRRIAQVRRALVPNREALGPLVRPDFEVHEDLVRAWPGTFDRLERAIDAIEKSRELLVGSFDIYLGRASQRSNDVMKLLTVVSAIALPPIVLAGVMGMNFQIPFFEAPGNFFVVVSVMIVFALVIIGVAKARDWI